MKKFDLDNNKEEAINFIEQVIEYKSDIFDFNEEIEKLQFYINESENILHNKEIDEVNEIKNRTNKVDWNYDYPIHWEEIFKSNLRTGSISTLWSSFEYYIVSFCGIIYAISPLELKYNNLKGGKLDQIKKYFKIFLEYNFNDWQSIKDIYLIRNLLVHNKGFIPESTSKDLLPTYIEYNQTTDTYESKDNNNIQINNNFIEINKEFCIKCCDPIKNELTAIEKEFIAYCESRKQQLNLGIKNSK